MLFSPPPKRFGVLYNTKHVVVPSVVGATRFKFAAEIFQNAKKNLQQRYAKYFV